MHVKRIVQEPIGDKLEDLSVKIVAGFAEMSSKNGAKNGSSLAMLIENNGKVDPKSTENIVIENPMHHTTESNKSTNEFFQEI